MNGWFTCFSMNDFACNIQQIILGSFLSNSHRFYFVSPDFLLIQGNHAVLNGAIFKKGLIHVTMHLFSNCSQMQHVARTKKWNVVVIAKCVTDFLITSLHLLHLSLERCTATWNLSVLHNNQSKQQVNHVIHTSVLQLIISNNQLQYNNHSTLSIKYYLYSWI